MVSYVILYAGQIAAWLVIMASDKCQMREFERIFLIVELLLMFAVTCFNHFGNKYIYSHKIRMLEDQIELLTQNNERLRMKNPDSIDKTEEKKHE